MNYLKTLIKERTGYIRLDEKKLKKAHLNKKYLAEMLGIFY